MEQDAVEFTRFISRLKVRGYKIWFDNEEQEGGHLSRMYFNKPYYIRVQFAVTPPKS